MTTNKKPAAKKTIPRRKASAAAPAAAPKVPAKAPAKAPASAKAKAKDKSKAKDKAKKTKTVRDSFNMPEHDYALIALLKKRALAAAVEIKKSELLRAGLKTLSRLPEKDFFAALKAVDPVKTGRPRSKTAGKK